ncbi:hypothetical protein [Streptomyces sp. S.PNR 29]|uniref:hypothetical protein n=1 Tax=Streptomyces sp. S.PNR 29 TaxID=2973805 RepID=UPI0025B0C264|nr:hypothetical protein [Streptomyces sp. S.PNR 29]MDN0197658.1 hypothetical protein [Streptomyces sp. S.PNR 29]
MTDGLGWLAAPRSIAFGGYSIVIARDLAGEEVARRITETVSGPRRRARYIGQLTGAQLNDVLEGFFGNVFEEIALRYGESDEWAYVVKYGGWQGSFGDQSPVSRGDAHVFHLEFEEENGKPVPPRFAYFHDGRLKCAFNLHLDGSWGYDGVEGDPEVASRVESVLAGAGLPDPELDRDLVHRISLEVIEECFGLTLPRRRILEETLPTAFLGRP